MDTVRLPFAAINAFYSTPKGAKAKQKRKADMLRQANHAVLLRAGDYYSFQNASRREGNSETVYQKCGRVPLKIGACTQVVGSPESGA